MSKRFDLNYMERAFRNPEIFNAIKNMLENSSDLWPVQETLEEFKDWQRVKYETTNMPKSSVHIGQLKLFLSEFQFLIDMIGGENDDNNDNKDNINYSYVVYAGSAPSMHLPFLLEAFPTVKFILIDPNEHVLFYKNKKPHYFTDQKDIIYLRAGDDDRYGYKRLIRIDLDGGMNFKIIDKPPGQTIQLKHFSYTDGSMSKYLTDLLKLPISSCRVIIIEDFFTNDTAKMIRAAFAAIPAPFFFFSDIRTTLWEMKDFIAKLNGIKVENIPMIGSISRADKPVSSYTDDEFPAEIDILANSAMQYNWLKIMKPKMSMLKFRCPFIDRRQMSSLKDLAALHPYKEPLELAAADGFNFVDDFLVSRFSYMKPYKVCLQAYPGNTSTETRYYVAGADVEKIVPIDIVDYENRLFYWNLVQRQLGFHNHKHFNENIGLDACGDCAIFVQLFERYSEKHKKIDVGSEIERVLNYIGRRLFSIDNYHGRTQHIPKDMTTMIIILVNRAIHRFMIKDDWGPKYWDNYNKNKENNNKNSKEK